MKTKLKLHLLLLALLSLSGFAHGQGTAIGYQGRLNDGGLPATGLYDFIFDVFDVEADGVALSGTTGAVVLDGVPVTNGLFNASLDFGPSVFTGPARWLQIGVRTNGSGGPFTPLNPRRAFTAVPYAITAGDVTGGNISRLDVPNTATQATGVLTVDFGLIVNAALTRGGSGYSATAASVTVDDPTGAGAVITAIVSGGAVIGLTVQDPGSGYSEGATLTISPPPSNAFQTFVSPNFFTGVNTMNNVNNTFAGSFTGDGAGLTLSANVPLLDGSPTFAGIVTAAGFSGPGALSWQVVADTAQQAQPNTGYLLTNEALVTVTLPTAPNPGDVVRLSGVGTGGWRMTQNDSQSVLTKNIPGHFGAVWTPRESNRAWNFVVSSSDGSKLAAVVYGGQIYTSTDSGETWTPRASNRSWFSVASSSDGSKLVVGVQNGLIYTSTDSGTNWTGTPFTVQSWHGVASSSNGTKLVAVVLNGLIYTSTDSGAGWTARDSNRNWYSVASSSDGSKLVAVANGGQIYISTDSGVMWTPRDSNRNWYSVASSSDGSKLVAVGSSGQIYTSITMSTSGTVGYLLGDQHSAVELQYIGNGQFVPLSHEGTIIAH